jgi:hypothetical protein
MFELANMGRGYAVNRGRRKRWQARIGEGLPDQMRNASNPLGDRKSRTPATQNAPSVQDYRQGTQQWVEQPNGRLLSKC